MYFSASEFCFNQDTHKTLSWLLPFLDLLPSFPHAVSNYTVFFLELIKQLSNNEIQL